VRAHMHLYCCCVSLAVSSTARELRFCVGHGGSRVLFTDSYSYSCLLHGTDLIRFIPLSVEQTEKKIERIFFRLSMMMMMMMMRRFSFFAFVFSSVSGVKCKDG